MSFAATASGDPRRDGEPVDDTLAREERWDELVARLVERAEAAMGSAERAHSLLRAAVIFETRLKDPERALLTLQAAFREDVTSDDVARELARLTSSLGRWSVVLADCQALLEGLSSDRQRADLRVALAKFHDRDLRDLGASERELNAALALDPAHPAALRGLVDIASRRGDWARAAQHLAQAVASSRHPAEKVRAHMEAASLFESRLKDVAQAMEHYRSVLELSPGHPAATAALTRLKAEAQPGQTTDTLTGHAESPRGSTAIPLHVARPTPVSLPTAAVSPPPAPFAEAPSAVIPEEEPLAELLYLARFAYDEQRWVEARKLGERALGRVDGPVGDERSDVVELVGRALMAEGEVVRAVQALTRGLDAVPEHRGCREAIIEACQRTGDEAAVTRHRQVLLEQLDSDDERFELLVREARRLRDARKDRPGAIKLFAEAMVLFPDDTGEVHAALHEMLDLLTDAKDWKGAVQVLERLAGLETGRARARYLVATANVLNYQLHALDEAIELYNKALDEDPEDLKTFERIERILTSKRAWRDEARNFQRMIKRLGVSPSPDQRPVALLLWKGLGETCRSRLKDLPAAAAAFEVCASLDPADPTYQEILAEIFERQGSSELTRAMEKRALLLSEALEPETMVRHIRAMLRIHVERRHHDRAWCACAALVACGAAQDKEREWYERFAARPLTPARAALSEEMWQRAVYHPREDRRLSQVFAVVSASVATLRAKEARAWGLDEKRRLNPTTDSSPLSQILCYASAVLNVGLPAFYVLPDRPGQIDLANVLDQNRLVPTFVAGADLLRPRGEREIAFVVGRALSLLRLDHLVLWPHVVATPAELRVVLLAVLKMFQPSVKISETEHSAVQQYHNLLQRTLPAQAMEPLMAVVPDLADLGEGVDLPLWSSSAFQTANRAGLLACGDLLTAMQAVREDANNQGVTAEEALTDLIRWSVSPEHLALREQLGLAIGP